MQILGSGRLEITMVD